VAQSPSQSAPPSPTAPAGSSPPGSAGATGASGQAGAGPTSSIDVSQAFTWVSFDGGFHGDWARGLAYFLLGFVGAAVTLYFFAGGLLPSMGRGQLTVLETERAQWERRRDRKLDAVEKTPSGAEGTKQKWLYERSAAQVTALDARIDRERGALLKVGVPLYLFLGGFFAAMFATNLIQAALIGFGWTAVVERFGLKREQETRKDSRDDLIDTLQTEAAQRANYIRDLEKASNDVLTEASSLRRQVQELRGPAGLGGRIAEGNAPEARQ
jgi:hypothetical protein